jgi:hypothetical protein
MKVANPQFHQAKKDKKLKSLILIKRKEPDRNGSNKERIYMRLCLEYLFKYSTTPETIFVETDSEIRIENYSSYSGLNKREINEICFHMDVLRPDSHVLSFLNTIKKESDVQFKVVAFNGCDFYKNNNLISHQLYGIIDEKCFLLSSYVGADNSASPVR